MRVSASKRAAVARTAARRQAETSGAVTVRPIAGPTLPVGSTHTIVPARSVWSLGHPDDGTASGKLPSTADPDAVERRAAAAAAARDALAVATGRAYGSPVRGYRSRRGYTWPGYSPVVVAPWSPAESERSSASRAVMTRKAGGAL